MTVWYRHRDGSSRSLQISDRSWLSMVGLHNFGFDHRVPVRLFNDTGEFIETVKLDANGHVEKSEA